MPSTQPVQYALLIMLAAIWGSSFLLIKVAVAEIPPLTVVSGRLLLGAAALYLFTLATGRYLPTDRRCWTMFAVIAVVGNVVPFALISWGELYIDSGLAAILMATMPLCTVLLAHAFTSDERLSARKSVGILFGYAGVVVLIGPEALDRLGSETLAQLAVALAACCYGISSVYARRLKGLPASVTAAGVLVCAAILAVPFSLVADRPWRLAPSVEALLALLTLGLLCTAAAYMILFHLLAAVGATFVALNNYLVPLFGVFWGATFLSEEVSLSALAALALILAGIGLIQRATRSVTAEPEPRPPTRE